MKPSKPIEIKVTNAGPAPALASVTIACTVPASPSPNEERESDPCCYCGHENGPIEPQTGRGILRVNDWDCCHCGAN